MKTVWIVQTYVPGYRVPFFEQLTSAVRDDGVDLRIVASKPEGEQAARSDAAVPSWLSVVDPRVLRAAGRSLNLTTTSRLWKGADGVVLPLSGSTADVYTAFARRRTSGIAVGLWGHVKSYVSRPNAVDAWLEKRLMVTCDQVFAYTQSGASFARERGVPDSRITTVGNTVDLVGLRAEMATVTDAQVEQFRSDHGLIDGRTLAFIGAIDRSKRIDFLVRSLDALWSVDTSIKLVVGGQGDQVGLLAPAIERGQVIYLGHAEDHAKAIIAKAAAMIVCPGRVGLIAVEALAMRLHVLTTDWAFHAPEIEYLTRGPDVTYTPDDPSAFAAVIRAVLDRGAPVVSSSAPEIGTMVANFRSGIRRMLD